MEMDQGLAIKYQRLNSLLLAGNVEAPHIQTEVADLLCDIRSSGESDEDIVARTDPRRFDVGFDPAAVVRAREGETSVED